MNNIETLAINWGIKKINLGTFEDGTVILNTQDIQQSSLIMFALALGFGYHGGFVKYHDKGKAITTVSYNTMVRLHNGYDVGLLAPDNWNACIREYFSKLPIKVGYYEYQQALGCKIVERVKLQRNKNGRIITQSHQIQWASGFAALEFGGLLESPEETL